jgi:uncharacterized protein (DUF2236 family)
MTRATGMAEACAIVNDAALERELAHLAAGVTDARAGLFGPPSMLWRVDREALTFLGAGRALLLQLAHPWVAAAIADHSQALDDPVGRFHRTFATVFALVFGPADLAFAMARRLHRRHAAITGTLPAGAGRFAAGAAYRANERTALQWVHATLVDTALQVYETVLMPLSAGEREAYHGDARRFAMLFGIPEGDMPRDWSGFVAYRETMVASDVLTVTPAARAIADRLFRARIAGMHMPGWYRDVTAALLPARFRPAFGFDFGPAEQESARRAMDWIRRVHPHLPDALRYVGPYLEACSRLAGRRAPGLATQLGNAFWIGRRRMAEER